MSFFIWLIIKFLNSFQICLDLDAVFPESLIGDSERIARVIDLPGRFHLTENAFSIDQE